MFSLFIFTFFLLSFYFLIKKDYNTKKIKVYLMIYLMVLGVTAYFYNPYKTADLYTIRKHITSIYQNIDIFDVYKLMSQSRMPLQILYYWWFVQVGNMRLLPCITALITYGNIFLIIYKSFKKNNWSNVTVANVLLIFMCTGQFIEVISGIRCMLAYSIISMAIYVDYYEEKGLKKSFPLYLVGAFIHDSSYPIIAIRLLMLIYQKNYASNKITQKIIKLFNILIFIIAIILCCLLFRDTITGVINHAKYYFNGGIYFYIWEYLIAMICMLYMLISMKVYKKLVRLQKIEKISPNYIKIISIIMAVNFLCFFEYSIFERYRILLLVLFLPIIGEILNYLRLSKDKMFKGYEQLTLFFIVLVYLLACVRGNLCNLNLF